MKRFSIFLLLLAIGLPWAANGQQTTLNEGFESTTFPPNEWSTIHVSGSSNWARSTSYYNSGSACAYMAYDYSGHENYLVTPKLTPASGESFAFYIKQTNSSWTGTTITVEVSTTTASAAAFTSTLATYTSGTGGNLSTSFESKSIDLSGYVGQNIYIAFHVVDNNGNNICIDDVSGVSLYVPSCPKPTNLTCTASTATPATATFSWTNGGTETNWVLEYGTTSDFTGASSQPISQSDLVNGTYTLTTGLTAETNYYAHIKADCGGGDESDWSNTIEFKPSNSFCNEIGTGTSTAYLVYTSYGCTYSQHIYTAAELTDMGFTAGDIVSVSFYYSGASSTYDKTQSIYMGTTTKSSYSGSSASDFESDVTLVYGPTLLSYVAGWREYELTEPFTWDGASNIVVGMLTNSTQSTSSGWSTYGTSTSPDYRTVYRYRDNTPIDITNLAAVSNGSRSTTRPNIHLCILSSATPKPRNLTVSATTSDGATLTWDAPANATPLGYYYHYKKATDAYFNQPIDNGLNTSVTLTGLDPNTEYMFGVYANYTAGAGDYAEITFTTDATCMPVTNITVSDITPTGAKLAWDDPNGASSWQYITVAHGDTPDWTSNLVNTSNTHANVPANILAGTGQQPQPNTEYDFYVRANCGGGDYSEAAMLTFRTACGAITSLPWTEDFNSYSTTATSTTAPSSYPNDVMPGCWTFLNRSDNSSSYPQVFLSSYSDYAVSGNCMFFKSSSSTPLYAVLPEFGNDIAGLELSFTYRNEGTGTSNGTLYVGYMTDPNDASTFNTENAVACAQTTSKTPMNVVLPNAPAGSYFAFKYQGGSANNYYLAIDNITVKEAVFVTANQIVETVSDPATEMTWNEFVNYWTNGDHFTSSTFTLMDDITVNTMVGTSDKPFTGTFDGNSHTITVNLTATAADFTAPFRIIRNATIQNLKVNGTINDGGFKFCAGFAGDCYGNNIFTNCESAVTINATIEGDGTHGGFIARNYGSTSSSNLCTTVFNGCAFTGQLLGANTTQVGGFCGWSEYNSPNYAKTMFNNCVFAPQAVTMSTTNSAAFARRRNASYVNFNNCYFMQDFNDGTNNTAQGKQAYSITGNGNVTVAMAGTHTDYSLSGISAYTNGIVYNNTIYAGGDETVTLDLSGADNYGANHGELSLSGSNYSLSMEAFDTQISAVTCPKPTHLAVTDGSVTNHTAKLTWEGTSASYNVKYRTAAGIRGIEEDFTGLTSGIPTGWDNSEGTSADSYKWSYYNSGHDAAPCVRFNSYSNSNNNTNFLKTPSMNFPANTTVTLSFWWKNPTGGDFSVYISTDGGSTKTEIATGLTGQSSWKQETFTLTNYVNMGTSNVTIHFKGTSNYGNGDAYIYLDDVVMGYEVAAGAWQYANNIEDEEVTLQGLDPETKYEAYLTGDCSSSGDGYSTEVGPVTFTTDIACPAPSTFAVSNVKSDRADLSWTPGYASAWKVYYKLETDSDYRVKDVTEQEVTTEGTTVTYTLTELVASTESEEKNYNVYVVENCGNGDGVSESTATLTFTTLEECATPSDITFSNIGHYTAKVDWTGDSDEFIVSYRVAEQVDGLEEEFNNSSLPSDWTQYSGLVDDVIAGSTSLSTGSDWGTSSNGLGAYNAKINIWGTSKKGWLVTPAITLGNNCSMSFDLALTDYNNSDPIEDATAQADDRFVVLVYANNAWTILREWNNSGSRYVYNSIATTGETISDIDISAYKGQTVKFAFYGESTESGGDNDLHIDNVMIGTPVHEGSWQTVSPNPTTTTANLSGLTVGTKYDVKVAPSCDPTNESDIVTFTTISPNEKYFITEGNWGTAANWEPEGAPTISQNVTLKANATIESGCVAEAKSINGTGTGTDAYTLTIENGGKLKHLNSGVRATVEKEIRAYITNYDEENYNNGDYYLIANPLTSTVTPDAENNHLLSGNYDLYNWDYTQDLEWRNYEASNFSLSSGAYGYLYANEAGATLTYTGTINAYTSNKSRYCSVASNPENYDFPSWYLLGNPYLYDAYLATAGTNGNALPYIKMNTTGDGFTNVAAGTPIEPMEGFFYQATTNASVYIVTTVPTVQSKAKLNMNLRKGNKQLDNAILVFGGEQQLGKMTFRANSSKIYMPKDGKDYAIVSTESNVGEMPVSFKAENNGTYTLSFNAEEVSFAYLHLIDNMTGIETDLLANPSYSFDARTTDYESRFKLVFATGNNANDDAFAFYSNGSFVINNEGEATLQVIDINGRILKSESINGCANVNVKAAAGVYMLRLVNGNDVKVQKVVVR